VAGVKAAKSSAGGAWRHRRRRQPESEEAKLWLKMTKKRLAKSNEMARRKKEQNFAVARVRQVLTTASAHKSIRHRRGNQSVNVKIISVSA
jgi:hypothetical protein